MDATNILIVLFGLIILYNIVISFAEFREGLVGEKEGDSKLSVKCVTNDTSGNIHSLENKLKQIEKQMNNNNIQVKENTQILKLLADQNKKNAEEKTGVSEEQSKKPPPKIGGLD